MTALHRKLWRELWGMRGQTLAIALVTASGIAVFIMAVGALSSLEATRTAFYERYRFAVLDSVPGAFGSEGALSVSVAANSTTSRSTAAAGAADVSSAHDSAPKAIEETMMASIQKFRSTN